MDVQVQLEALVKLVPLDNVVMMEHRVELVQLVVMEELVLLDSRV
jgi:hypothetical protein